MAISTGIVIVENTFLVRAGLESLIQELSGMYILAIFDGSEKGLVEKIRYHKPDLVLINPDAIGEEFIQLVNQLQHDDQMKLIGLRNKLTAANIMSRFKHCLDTADGKHELMEQLRKTGGGLPVKKLVETQTLSEREAEILRNISLGLTNQEIADKLFLSIHTVTTHRKNITKKLGIKTVSGLTVYALMNKLVDLAEIERK